MFPLILFVGLIISTGLTVEGTTNSSLLNATTTSASSQTTPTQQTTITSASSQTIPIQLLEFLQLHNATNATFAQLLQIFNNLTTSVEGTTNSNSSLPAVNATATSDNTTYPIPSSTTPMNTTTSTPTPTSATTQPPRYPIVIGLRARITTTVALDTNLANSILQQYISSLQQYNVTARVTSIKKL
ncbi:uncharacterized protein Hap1MRO34_009560 [Clarias gariepinus]